MSPQTPRHPPVAAPARTELVRLNRDELEVLLLALDPGHLRARLHPARHDAAGSAQDAVGAALRRIARH